MKTITIRWQRLVDETGQTCTRCGSTGEAVQNSFNKLKKALAELDIEVNLETETMGFSTFNKDPLESNRIWIGDRPLEEWIGATIGKSKCCDVCGDSECRTISIGKSTLEAVPESLIIKAGLMAAAELCTDQSNRIEF